MGTTNDTDIYQGLITTEWGGMVNNPFNAYQVKNVYADMYGTQSQTPPANDTGAAGIASAVTAWDSAVVPYIDGTSASITAASNSGQTITITTGATAVLGQAIVVSGLSANGWTNAIGTFQVTAVGTGTLSYVITGAAPTGAATLTSALCTPITQYYLGEVLPNVRSTYLSEIGD